MTERPVILTVDRNRRNQELLAQFLGKEGYQTLSATTLGEFDQALEGTTPVALALVDLAGFDQHIWERCDRLRQAHIPFLMISPRQVASVHQAGLAHGARGVLVKPLAAKELLGLIRSLLGG